MSFSADANAWARNGNTGIGSTLKRRGPDLKRGKAPFSPFLKKGLSPFCVHTMIGAR